MRARPFTLMDDDAPDPVAAEHEREARAALVGDAAAWSRLIARHDHTVVVALLARGVPLDRAREITQDTWLRLMEQQRAGRLRELRLPGLAIVQAGFLAASEHRRGARFVDAPEPSADSSSGATAEQTTIQKERLRRVARALNSCPANARRVFELVYDNPELTYAEVATRVGLSTQRVKQIVCEVRQRLRDALDEEAS
jgi:RNA polymerase sigma factor (sigma-70 family)